MLKTKIVIFKQGLQVVFDIGILILGTLILVYPIFSKIKTTSKHNFSFLIITVT